VELSATVAPTAFIGPNAIVTDEAQVLGSARIEKEAVVGGSAMVGDESVITDRARVNESAKVLGKSRIGGSASVGGYAVLVDAALDSGDLHPRTKEAQIAWRRAQPKARVALTSR
jgi:UDP-3-O-[3-hydroxymyristoyl] glucosamine N-acyltransferase